MDSENVENTSPVDNTVVVELLPVVHQVSPKLPVANDDKTLASSYHESDVEDDADVPLNSGTSDISPELLIAVESLDLSEIAKSAVDDSSDPHVSAEELKLIMSSTVNTCVYEKSRRGVEQHFFEIIDKYGGSELRKLTLFADDGFQKERVFYIKLRDERMEVKRFILNRCLVKIALKWRSTNKNSKDYGQHLQPSTWEKLMNDLFSIFWKTNINYFFQADFNGDGEFHAVLVAQRALQRESDPTFATDIGTATFDIDADLKLREHYRSGTFNPFSKEITKTAYHDRLKYAIWVLGRYLLCCRCREIAFCEWNQIKFHEVVIDGVKEEYMELIHQWILVIINWPGYSVDVYDSLDNKNVDVCATFLTLLLKYQKESDGKHWQAHNHYHENLQWQFDSYSCGYFTCWYAYQLVNNRMIGLFTNSYEDSIANIASKIVISLIEASNVL
jgi:hypothetical protein